MFKIRWHLKLDRLVDPQNHLPARNSLKIGLISTSIWKPKSIHSASTKKDAWFSRHRFSNVQNTCGLRVYQEKQLVTMLRCTHFFHMEFDASDGGKSQCLDEQYLYKIYKVDVFIWGWSSVVWFLTGYDLYCSILQRVFVFILKQMVKKHPKSSCIQTLICYSFELAFLGKDQQTNQLWCLEVGDRNGRKQLLGDMIMIKCIEYHPPFGCFMVSMEFASNHLSNTYTVAIHWIFCTCDGLHSAFVPLLQRCVTAWMCLGPASAVATLKKCIAKVYIPMNGHFFALFWLMTMVDTDSQCCTCCVSWETRMKYVYIIYGSSWICATCKGLWISLPEQVWWCLIQNLQPLTRYKTLMLDFNSWMPR